MAKLAASSRLSLSDPQRSATDVSWTFSLRRAPGSDAPAARMSGAALRALAYGTAATRVAEAVRVARGYVLAHGQARRVRVPLGVDRARRSVCVTDTGYGHPPTVPVGVPPEPPSRDATTRLCRAPAGPGRVHRLSPDAPDHSRGPGARG
ncbi:hypothetical protein OG937_27340 [Streptomyces sp. NBC_00510]